MLVRQVNSPQPVAQYLAATIKQHLLQDRPVLWLLSGGSYIETQVQASKLLAGTNLGRLSVSLLDERYGPVGHPDSNWQKLLAAGLTLPGARLVPVLNGKDFESTVHDFAHFIDHELKSDAYKLASIGVGQDGHTLGVLTGSPGIDSQELVVGYNAADFERITTTLESIKYIDEAVVYMTGAAKHQLIDQLTDQNITYAEQPAQAIKQAKSVLLYNDYKGEKV